MMLLTQDIQKDLHEANCLLEELKKDSKIFFEEDIERKIKRAKLNSQSQQKTTSSSSWALSKTKRDQSKHSQFKLDNDHQIIHLNVAKSELAESRKAVVPVYSFPKARPTDSTHNNNGDTPLNPNIDVISTKQRPYAVKLAPPSTPKPVQYVESQTVSITAEPLYQNTGYVNRGHAFGNDARFKVPFKGVSANAAALDVDAGLKLIKPRAPAAVIPKPSSTIKLVNSTGIEMKQTNDDSRGVILDSNRPDIDPPLSESSTLPTRLYSVDVLSHRARSPSVVNMSANNTSKSRVLLKHHTPGPGEYNSLSTFGEDNSGGKIYRGSSHNMKPKAKAVMELNRTKIPGPGDYSTDQAELYLRRVHSALNMSHQGADSKVSDRLAAKQYWEAKARDAREDHDDMHETNTDILRPRTPTVTFRPDEKKSAAKLDEKKKKTKSKSIIDEINAELGIDDSFDHMQEGASDLNYSLVEKKTACGVNMARQEEIRRSLLERAQSKPGITERNAQESHAQMERSKYYGPQLQVTWATEVGKQTKIPAKEDPDSPTKLTAEIFDRDAEGEHDANFESEYAEAFLKSSLAGVHRSAISFKHAGKSRIKPTQDDRSRAQRDFIGPQVIKDWSAPTDDDKYKYQSYSMDLTTGRDVIKSDGKRKKLVIPFTTLPESTDKLGPGMYNPNNDDFASVNVKGVPFSRFSEVLKPDCDGEDGGEYPVQLDLDVNRAFEKNQIQHTRSFALYKHDRFSIHPEIDPDQGEVLDLGEKGFKAFAEAASEWNHVNFDKMRGRTVTNYGDDIDDKEGAVLDLDVKDWNPRAPSVQAYVFPDSDNHPRFPSPPTSTEPQLILEPNYKYKDKKSSVVVDMSKQNYLDKQSNTNPESNTINRELAIELEIEREAKIKNVYDNKRKITAVDMSKYRGKEDDANNWKDDFILDLNVKSDMNKPKTLSGVAMNKRSTRGSLPTSDHAYEDDAFDEEELILSPRVESSSKFPGLSKNVSWKFMEGCKDESPSAEKQELILEHVDPSVFKKGFSKSSSMSIQAINGKAQKKSNTINKAAPLLTSKSKLRSESDITSAFQRLALGDKNNYDSGIVAPPSLAAPTLSVIYPDYAKEK